MFSALMGVLSVCCVSHCRGNGASTKEVSNYDGVLLRIESKGSGIDACENKSITFLYFKH